MSAFRLGSRPQNDELIIDYMFISCGWSLLFLVCKS